VQNLKINLSDRSFLFCSAIGAEYSGGGFFIKGYKKDKEKNGVG